MEVAAFIISVLALLLSFVVAYVENKREYRINRINIDVEFYKDIYKKHLIQKIPEARRVMRFDETYYLKDAKMLVDELNEIRRDSLYFLYNNKDFYIKLKDKLQSLEDYLIQTESKRLYADEQTLFWNKVQNDLNDIYKIVADAYQGKYG